jgi:hypothetical protein
LNQRWLFSLDVAEIPPDRTRLAINRSLVRSQPPTQTLRYQVTSRLGEMASDNDQFSIRIPDNIDSRVLKLAQSWRDQASEAQQIITLGIAYFKNNNFTYSLSPGVMEGDDVADFLFNKRAGFCSHYATSFSLLMRCAGLPSRVVVGFHRGDLNQIGDFLIIRHDHAHAWSEVQIQGQWQRIDPTVGLPLAPGQTRPAALRNASSDTLANSDRKVWWMPDILQTPYSNAVQYWQFIEAKWESTVMGYDAESQSLWLSNVGITQYATPILLGGVVVVIVGGIIAMVWWRRRTTNEVVITDPIVLWYNRFCAHLAEVGVKRLPHEGPLDFSQRAAAALPNHSALITRLGNDYIALRYGTTTVNRAIRARLHADLRLLPKRPATSASASSVPS